MRPDKIVLPSEVRRALLAEHGRIKTILAEAEDLAERVRAGDDTDGRFMVVTGRLRFMLATHNQNEEATLEPILFVAGAWGGLRVEQKLNEHRREHAELLATLDGDDPEILAAAIPRLAASLRAHMAHEESTFLSRAVMR